MSKPRGIHPRLIPPPPSARASLPLLSQLAGMGEEGGWALWYCVWKTSGSLTDRDLSDHERQRVRERFRQAGLTLPDLRNEFDALAEFACGDQDSAHAADALFRVAEWAAQKELPLIAIYCAEASATLRPDSPAKALAAGRTNRLWGDLTSRADIYYERAVPLARRARDWRVYVRAHLGKGHVRKTFGDNDGARAHFITAARAANTLSGEKWLAGQTQHDLLVLAAEEGDFSAAVTYAEQALDRYPLHHERIPGLVHDFAFVLLRMGLFDEAVDVLEVVMRSQMPPQDQVIGWSTLAHAAAGTGDRERYRFASDNTLRLVGLFDLHAAAALSNLACGAQLLGLRADAEQYASRSLQIADQRQQSEAVPVARAVLETLGGKHPWHAHEAVTGDLHHRAVSLIPALTARVVHWRGPAYRLHKPRRKHGQSA